MGGFGSGWRRPKRRVVERCHVLAAGTFIRSTSAIDARAGVWGWGHPTRLEARFEIQTVRGQPTSLWLGITRPSTAAGNGLGPQAQAPSQNIRFVSTLHRPRAYATDSAARDVTGRATNCTCRRVYPGSTAAHATD